MSGDIYQKHKTGATCSAIFAVLCLALMLWCFILVGIFALGQSAPWCVGSAVASVIFGFSAMRSFRRAEYLQRLAELHNPEPTKREHR